MIKLRRQGNFILIKKGNKEKLDTLWLVGIKNPTEKIKNLIQNLKRKQKKLKDTTIKAQIPNNLQKLIPGEKILFSTSGLLNQKPITAIFAPLLFLGFLSGAILITLALGKVLILPLIHALITPTKFNMIFNIIPWVNIIILLSFMVISYGATIITYKLSSTSISLRGYKFIGTEHHLIISGPKMFRFIGWEELENEIELKRLIIPGRGVVKLKGSLISGKYGVYKDQITLYGIKNYKEISDTIKKIIKL